MTPVDLLLSRLDRPTQSGRDRWRCACPVCGERNRSTLSVGIGDNGCVLVKCFKSGCSPNEIAAAVGLDLEDLFPPRESSSRPLQRPRLMTHAQALGLLEFESLLVVVAANNLAHGHALTPDDLARLSVAARRIGAVCDEARR
jgi:hypothetical protein